MNFRNNFKLGNLILPNNIIYAPLAEYTDYSYRRLIRHFHKGLIFCEMVKMDALVREKTCKILKYNESMKPIGAQLCGTDPKVAKDAAKKIEDLGFDIVDLNCGCPVPKVVKNGCGAALLKNPKLIFQILTAMKSSVSIPVTVKIRLGWDDNTICFQGIVKIAEEAGCSAITIHGRTKKQAYSGKARWEYIKEAKNKASKILVIGNGDLNKPKDVDDIFKITNCDGVMLARGILSNPHLGLEIEKYFIKEHNEDIKFNRKKALLDYISYVLEEKDKHRTLLDIRRISGWMLRERNNIKQLRIAINTSKSLDEAIRHIQTFDW